MRGLRQGFQTQTPPDRTQATSQRRKTLSVSQVSQEVFSLRLLQPAHQSPILVLQTLQVTSIEESSGELMVDFKQKT